MGMDRAQKFQEIAVVIEQGKDAEPMTVRELLEVFGYHRRGANVVESVRNELHSYGLATEPDFEDAWLDQRVYFVRSHNDDNRPLAGWRRHFLQIASQIESGVQPEPVTVRTMLSWFGAERRGSYVVQEVESVLEEFGLRTEPDFRSVYIDAEIQFCLAKPKSSDTSSPIVMESPEVELPPAAATPAPPAPHEQEGTKIPADEPSIEAPPPSSPVAPPVGIADPTFRIGTLRSANLKSIGKELIRLSANDTIMHAITVMLSHDVSQLPVMQGDRQVRGVVTWQSIGSYLALDKTRTSNDQVFKCMGDPHILKAESSLLAAIPGIMEHNYVLIKDGQGIISGIVTTNDLSLQFRELAEPFLLLGEIENYIRVLMDRGAFRLKELKGVRNGDDQREIKSVADLTLGEIAWLLKNPENWNRLNMAIDGKSFVEDLDKVREIRNDVMHFRPDPLPVQKLHVLQRFAKFLQDLRQLRAI